MTSCDLGMHGIMNLMSVLILPSRMESQTTFGRCTRTGISWDNEFELFRVNSDVEEISTRSQDISMDYDFFIPMKCHWNVATIMK